MGINITYNLQTDDGKSIEAMSNIIKARKDELGETTKQSTVAFVINVLKSLRADTLVAKVKGSYKIKKSGYVPSWKNEGGQNKRCLRSGNQKGQVIEPQMKIVWMDKKYRGQKLSCYFVQDIIGKDVKREYLLIVPDMQIAKEEAAAYHEKRVKEHRGLAKIALGMAMHEVHKLENVNDNVNTDTKNLARDNIEGKVTETGYNSGNVNVYVYDRLDYAGDALRHGPNYVSTATQKTLNKMTAYLIHKLHGKGIQTSLQIPYPELKKGCEG